MRAVADGELTPTAPEGEQARDTGSHWGIPADVLMSRAPDLPWPNADELPELLTETIDRLGLRQAKESGAIDDIFSLADLLFTGDVRDELAGRLMVFLGAQGELSFGSPSQWIPSRVIELSAGRCEFNGSPLDRLHVPDRHRHDPVPAPARPRSGRQRLVHGDLEGPDAAQRGVRRGRSSTPAPVRAPWRRR